MRRLRSNPVQELRRILRDQYSFSSIVKELVQNADDAGAEEFHLGWALDWPPNTHPLLAGPAVLVLNDGEFRPADAQTIWRLDEGAKGDDVGTIGKYGMGMKSIFHLCEGFFYAASPNQPAAEGNPFVELLNPWPEGGPHDDWSDPGKANSAILDSISSWAHSCEQWFCLVIPLRMQAHLNGAEAIVQGEFPTIDRLRKSYDVHELASFTPLLRSLNKITVWTWNDRDRNNEILAKICCADSGRRCLFPKLDRGSTNILRTKVLDRSEGEKVILRASGVERLLDDRSFDELKADDRWPKNVTLNPQTGKSEDILEKAEPHCAAVFAKTLHSSDTLDIRYAVFLPLSGGLLEQVSTHGSGHYELTLHGQFFLDAGRRELYQNDGQRVGLQEKWNEHLLHAGVLPLVLPALDEFVRTWSLGRDDVTTLTTAIGQSNLFERYRANICSSHNWLGRVDFDTKDTSWQLVDSSTSFFLLPSLTERVDVAHNLFPALPQLCRDQFVTEKDRPRLTCTEPTPWSEQENVLCELLRSMNPESMINTKALGFAADFFGLLEGGVPENAAQILIEKLAQVVAAHGIRALDKVKSDFVALIEKLPPSMWVRLGPFEKDAANLYRDLNVLGLNHVVLPPELVPASRVGDKLSISETGSVFSWLKRTAKERSPERTSAVALYLIDATGESIEAKRTQLGDIPLFLVRDGAKNKDEWLLFSWRKLHRLFSEHRLFSGGSAHLRALQKALRDTQVCSLYAPRDTQPFRILFDVDPQRCDVAKCLMFLSRERPVLASADNRVDLLKQITPSIQDGGTPEHRRAIRYLLHAIPDSADDIDTPLLIRPQGDGVSHLARVAEHALQRQGSQWRWIPEVLWRHLNPAQQERLGLAVIGVDEVESLLGKTGVDWIRELGLSEDEAMALLRDIRDNNLWRQLPVHRTVSGARISLNGPHVYMQLADNCALPLRLSDVVTILRRPPDEDLVQKYQRNGISEWTEQATIEVALERPAPCDFANVILDAVQRLCDSDTKLSPDLLDKLKHTKWILTKSGSAVSPSDVIHLPQLDDHLQRLLANPEVEHAFRCTAQLDDSLREHRAFGLLRQRKVFPDKLESVHVLALCLSQVPRYRLGALPNSEVPDDSQGLKLLLNAFTGIEPTAFPVLSLLQVLSESFPDDADDIARTILPELRKELPFTRLKECVIFLAEQSCTQQSCQGVAAVTVLRGYLRQFLSHPDYDREHLDTLQLPNRLRQLKPAHALCVCAEGIDPACLLHEELAKLFPSGPSGDDTKCGEKEPVTDTEAASPAEDPAVLVQYMRRWEGLVPKQLRGGLLALFGDDETILKHASDLLHPLSVRNFRAELEWPPHPSSRMIGANEDVHETMSKQRFVFQLAAGSSMRRVPNLLGRWFEAPIGGEIKSVFVGSIWTLSPVHVSRPGLRVKLITLREFDAAALPRQQRHEVLFESARVLLKDVYNRRPANLDEVWGRLAQSAQLELEIVQDQLLKNAWFYFQQLGDRRLPSLDALLRKYDDLSDREIELRRSTAMSAQEDMREMQRELAALPNQLRELLITDAGVQKETLDAIRAKMKDYEYSANSIPFELFQNADDAAAELADMLGESAPESLRRVVFALDDEHLILVHWGRPINEFCRADFCADEGRERGYDKDLKKMLILSASDKGQRSELVTGKFGLGFKSIFFLTDRPQVLSGSLSFEVLGGFFPSQASPDTERSLAETPQLYGPSGGEATVINLPLATDKRDLAREALRAFGELLPISLIFSRHIKECILSYEDRATTVRLEERRVADCPRAFVCRIGSDAGQSSLTSERFLVLTADRNGSLLLGLGPEGFRRIPETVPTFWVTAPTKTRRNVGVAVHGHFAVDVGRNQLAESEDNEVLARTIGASVGVTLVELFDAAAQWDRFRNELDLAHDVCPEDLWLSLWELLSRDCVRMDPILRAIFCTPRAGLMRLIDERDALPTALPAPFDGLTRLGEVRAEVSGTLDQDETVLRAVLSWPALGKIWHQGHLISGRHVAVILRKVLGPSAVSWTQFTLLDAVQAELGDAIEVEPETAKRLGVVLNRKNLRAWERQHTDELGRIRKFLGDLRFRTVDEGCSMPGDLVTSQVGGDEALRAAFAPAERHLSPAYTDSALQFFLVCRPEMRAPVAALADWAKDAESEDSRVAVLRYLLDGELGQKLAEELQRGGHSGWLEDIPYSCLAKFSEQEKLQIRAKLGLGENELREKLRAQVLEELRDQKPRRPVVSDSKAALEEIYQWWETEGPERLAILDRRLYPNGTFFKVSHEAPSTPNERAEWLKLFLLGSLQTIGRTMPEANRGFIERCEQLGWIDDLAAAHTQRDRWLESWMTYMDEQETEIRYFQWMKHLIGLALIAVHLDDYVELFLAADRIKPGFSLPAITRPRLSTFFQGGGPDAPPISEVLGIGQCFIMRELVRHGVLKSERVYPHCYVPFKRTRDVFVALGDPDLEENKRNRWEHSRVMFEFLKEHLGDRATFEHSFDIPLMLVGEQSELGERFLGELPDELPDETEET